MSVGSGGLGIWMERNNPVFNNCTDPSFRVFSRAKEFLFFLVSHCKGCEGLKRDMLIYDWEWIVGL